MTDSFVAQLRELAVDIAVRAARLVIDQRRELGAGLEDTVTTKSSEVDPVTAVDRASEVFIVSELYKVRPDDGVVAEEGHSVASRSGVSWIIDPIDGTVNFLYAIPHYAVSIAAAYKGHLCAGAVVNCATGVCYSAGRGQGAHRLSEGQTVPVHCSNTRRLSQALVATGFSYEAARREAQAALLAQVLPQVRDIRRQGSAALDLCSLAEGSVDAYYEHALNAWDYAAGALIAQEAGAIVDIPPLKTLGSCGKPVVASSPGIAQQFQNLAERSGIYAALPTRPEQARS